MQTLSETLPYFLLLLHSQLYVWGSPSWERFLHMWVFLNPATEVVTFCLHGWYMLAVCLSSAFTRLGHERKNLLSLCDGMHVWTDQTSVYTLIRKSFGEWSQNPCLLQVKNPLYWKNSPQRGSSPWRTSPTHYQGAILAPFLTLSYSMLLLSVVVENPSAALCLSCFLFLLMGFSCGTGVVSAGRLRRLMGVHQHLFPPDCLSEHTHLKI